MKLTLNRPVFAATLSAGLTVAAMLGMAGGASAQALPSLLNGKICAGTMSGDGGSGGAAAFSFSEQGGTLTARQFYSLGYVALTNMTQALSVSATPSIVGLTDAGYVTNLQVAGSAVTFDRQGRDPRTGAQVVFRTYRLAYAGDRLTGKSTPQNAVMQNGEPGVATDFNLKCYPATGMTK